MCESYSTLCKKFIFCCQVKRKNMNTEVIKRIMNTLYLFGYSDVSDIYSDKQNWSYSQCLLLKRKKLWLNLERKSEIQAFHPFTMKKILQQLKKKQYYAKKHTQWTLKNETPPKIYFALWLWIWRKINFRSFSFLWILGR